MTILRINIFNNIDQKYFYLLVFEGEKLSWKTVIKQTKRGEKKRNKDNTGRKNMYLLSGQVIVEKLPISHSRQ